MELNNSIIKGNISITDNFPFINDLISSMQSNTKIIVLEEETNLPLNHPNVINGSCLLPPIEALIAEVDGNKPLFESIYNDYLNSPFVFEFMSAIITALHNSINIILYYPGLNGNIIIQNLLGFIYQRYGIGIGVIGYSNTTLNPNYSSLWISYMYITNGISGMEFLYYYPENIKIEDNIIDKIILDLKLYVSPEHKESYIYGLVHKVKEKKNLKMALQLI